MRLRLIDASNIEDHSRLQAGDQCYFFLEYTSGQSFSFGEANNLIGNLKKTMDRAGRPEWAHKLRAIQRSAELIRAVIDPAWPGALVPTPPSKAKADPLYDDRMLQICRLARPGGDVRELVEQVASIRASHASEGNRPSVAELAGNYRINEAVANPPPPAIIVVDDVLTAGNHFRAASDLLRQRFPDAPIVGLFIARRVFPT